MNRPKMAKEDGNKLRDVMKKMQKQEIMCYRIASELLELRHILKWINKSSEDEDFDIMFGGDLNVKSLKEHMGTICSDILGKM
jgi:hypothetical protein